MAMKTINGIRYREEDVELFQPVLDKALHPEARVTRAGSTKGKRQSLAKGAKQPEATTVGAVEGAEATETEAAKPGGEPAEEAMA